MMRSNDKIKLRQQASKPVPNAQVDSVDNNELFADMSVMEHLIELRRHLIRIVIAITVIFLPLALNAPTLYDYFASIITDVLPSSSSIISTSLAKGFIVPLQLSFFLALFIAMPYIIYEIWVFVAPGLYKHEKYVAVPILLSSIILFYLGAAFAYFVILKRALIFFISVLPDSVLSMPDISDYLDLSSKLIFVFGLAFEVPVLVLILILTGVVSLAKLKSMRRYVFLICFAAAGVMSPPDVISMFMLAIPMYLLFELGLFMAKLLVKDSKQKELNDR